jgi:hypothetical protein
MADAGAADAASAASPWQAFTDDDTGDVYFFNSETQESTWEKPPGFVMPVYVGKRVARVEFLEGGS